MRQRALLAVAIGVVALAVGFAVFVSGTPPLPPETDAVIDAVLASELPELITGTTGPAMSGDVSIWYEQLSAGDGQRPAVLLIMGAGASALAWPEHFYGPLIESGYQVVRYDNRGLGLSDWMEDWDAAQPYTIEDLALDAIAVLDELEIDRAHIVGISMGGMIGQRLAISHAGRVASLTSISSSGWTEDPSLPDLATPFGRSVTRLAARYLFIPTARNRIKFGLGMLELLKGTADQESDLRQSIESML